MVAMKKLLILLLVLLPLAAYAVAQTVTLQPGDTLTAHCATSLSTSGSAQRVTVRCRPRPTLTPTRVVFPTSTMPMPTATLALPTVTPPGQPVPVARQTCPAWVHDQYVATGPDGMSYPTFHPPIDPQYHCYFRHEHGGDPSSVIPGYHPLFGYDMPEAHVGFKVYPWIDNAGRHWVFVHHQGTGTLAGFCARFHALDVALMVNGVLLADMHTMADHGRMLAGSNVPDGTSGETTLSACPNQGAETNADNAFGARIYPVRGFSFNDSSYVPWRIYGKNSEQVIGFSPNNITFNTPFTMVIAEGVWNATDHTVHIDTAQVPKPAIERTTGTPQDGTLHHVTFNNNVRVWAAGSHSGVFSVLFDMHGRATVVPAGTAGALRQYIAPGTDVTSVCNGKLWPSGASPALYHCGVQTTSNFLNPENSIPPAPEGNN